MVDCGRGFGTGEYERGMQYICDAPDNMTWFRIETEVEAAKESELMQHAVEKHYLREMERSKDRYQPTSSRYIERDIGLKAHLERDMPMFLTLRNHDGEAKVTAMLPPGGKDDANFRFIVVGPGNGDPYPDRRAAIEALGAHLGLKLDRARCYPYDRG